MMRNWMLSELQAPTSGKMLGADCEVTAVSTDTRQAQAGALFVALRGENFDGHSYVDQAHKSGAVAAMVSCEVDSALPQLKVSDTQRALGALGAYNRQDFTGTLVAVTGSSGKTTVKNMIHAVLSRSGSALATEGNLNNEIGVPLTLLNLSHEHEFAVVEMGAARKGDIAWLCELGRPSIALLLNAMPAHLQGFGSVDEVAAAKGEIFDGLDSSATAVINADQPWADQWRQRAEPAAILSYGLEKDADISATSIRPMGVQGVSFELQTPAGATSISLRLPGKHNVSNALAAVAVGIACDMSLEKIRQGLESVTPVAGRLSVGSAPSGADVIDDCYNANPGSVRAAIDVLEGCIGKRTLILGAMKELGPGSASLHREVGRYARERGLEQFWGVGPELEQAVAAFGDNGRYFSDTSAAVDAAAGAFSAGDSVLVKGSRGAMMEVVVHALRAQQAGGEG